MNEKEDNLSQQLIELGFPDYQVYDLVLKLKGTDLSGKEFILLEHPFKSSLDIPEVFREITKGAVLQKLNSITSSEYAWCFRPDSTFDDNEEFSGRISRHILDPKSSQVKNFEFLVETADCKLKVVTRITEYVKGPQSLELGLIGPTGFFSFQQ